MSSKHSRIWYVNHLLAALSVLLLVVMPVVLLMIAGFELHDELRALFASPRMADVLSFVALPVALCLLASLWLWAAMMHHYLRNRAAVSKGWLFWLIASNWGAAIVYFFVVWRPQARHERA